jgi:hypothetical protein
MRGERIESQPVASGPDEYTVPGPDNAELPNVPCGYSGRLGKQERCLLPREIVRPKKVDGASPAPA